MTRLAIPEARRFAEARGFNVFEQRGFYSHFLRVRRGLETLNCIDIRRKSVSRRSLLRALEKKLAP